MTRFKIVTLASLGAASLAALVGSVPLASAAPAASATIAARQANFKKMGGAMKVLKDELGGGADKAKMLAAAKTIAAMSRAQVSMFPAGTGASAGVKTDALPAIWSQRAAFDASAKKMIVEADKLVAAAGSGDSGAIGAQYKVVGATCGARHRQFRADD